MKHCQNDQLMSTQVKLPEYQLDWVKFVDFYYWPNL